jgi:hypothetical protein
MRSRGTMTPVVAMFNLHLHGILTYRCMRKWDMLLFPPFGRCNSHCHTILTDLSVWFPATDEWKARESWLRFWIAMTRRIAEFLVLAFKTLITTTIMVADDDNRATTG